jgi:glucose/mannose-6-phosphate isomerase
MMQDAILDFSKQFQFKPKVVNAGKLKKTKKFVVCGMGGSHLAADLLNLWDKSCNIIVHSDYGLPALSDKELKDRLIILSSYSGNTEEVLDACKEAKIKKLKMAIICVGGKLLELAKKHGIPYVEMPNTGIQPRSALGFSIIGLMALMGMKKGIAEAQKLAKKLNVKVLENIGKSLAGRLQNHVPVIYSSEKNRGITYNWKIKLNETGKIPALYNVFPELNHNEMNGFDVDESTKKLSENFYFIFLSDSADHPQIKKRMKVMQKLYADRNLKTETMELSGGVFDKIFNSLVIADWTAVYLAEHYGLDSEQVPMVEEFKRLIAK